MQSPHSHNSQPAGYSSRQVHHSLSHSAMESEIIRAILTKQPFSIIVNGTEGCNDSTRKRKTRDFGISATGHRAPELCSDEMWDRNGSCSICRTSVTAKQVEPCSWKQLALTSNQRGQSL